MAIQATVQLANVKYTAEKPPTSGNFLETIKTWFDGSAGAFDFMNALKKAADLSGNDHILKQAKGYIAGTSIPRVYTTALTACRGYKALREGRVDKHQGPIDFAHQVFDFFLMSTYSFAFFRKTPTTSLQAATVLNVGCDATDVLSFGVQSFKGWERRAMLATANPVIQKANENAFHNALIKLAKSVTAFIASIFSVFLLITGTVLVAPAIAVTVALSSSIFNILAYYHKNYWCDTALKIDYLPVKQA